MLCRTQRLERHDTALMNSLVDAKRHEEPIHKACGWRNGTTTREYAPSYRNAVSPPIFIPAGKKGSALNREAGFKVRSFVVERAHWLLNRFRRLLVGGTKSWRSIIWRFSISPVV
jgi:hypothetical protein